MKSARLALLTMVFSACAVGIEPPEVTDSVLIDDGLTYTFGTTVPCREGVSVECQVGESIPLAYPTVTLKLEAFRFDVHEVTNLQYQYCVAMGDCAAPKFGNTQNILDYYGDETYANSPVVNVSFKQAKAYCEFVGKRLPTEYEWERVAKGPDSDDARIYPSDGFDSTSDTCGELQISGCSGLDEGNPIDVMTSSNDFVEDTNGKVWDLLGNVTEWTSSYYEGGTTGDFGQQLNWVTCDGSLPADCNCLNCKPSPDQAFCLTNCGNCAECADNTCFQLCEGISGLGNFPVCIPYEGEQVPADIWASSGSQVLSRGGNYSTKKGLSCGLRSADRTFVRSVADDGTSPVVGFRCAQNAE